MVGRSVLIAAFIQIWGIIYFEHVNIRSIGHGGEGGAEGWSWGCAAHPDWTLHPHKKCQRAYLFAASMLFSERERERERARREREHKSVWWTDVPFGQCIKHSFSVYSVLGGWICGCAVGVWAVMREFSLSVYLKVEKKKRELNEKE